MPRALLGVVLLTALLAHAAAAGHRTTTAAPTTTYSYQILNAPTSSDERAIRTLGLIPTAQRRSDRLFNALHALLGGDAPKLNFVPTGSPLTPMDSSANVVGVPGGPVGTINVDPLAVEAMINDASPYHDSGVNGFPHEMAHLRQTAQTLASLAQSEGGAQAFADTVTPAAARQAGIPYTPGNFDGLYAAYVKQAQQRGRDWILAGQFGKPGSPTWP